jgi:hypothetical protein
MKISAFDYDNVNTYEIANFYFDITNPDQDALMQFSSPPLLFQEKLWGKRIEFELPSVYAISDQREDGNAVPNSINSNLTNGKGLSNVSPIFIDFYLIQTQNIINGVKTYKMAPPVQFSLQFSLPITPDFQNLGVRIDPSEQGDYFEIYGIFNDNIVEFKQFIDDSFLGGKRYYVEYVVTTYEENIKGRTQVYTVDGEFNVPIEYRPIIKSSTTTAIIEVQMNVINQVDDSQIVRRASYGMLPDEVSKYALNLSKINVDNIIKPKIYNLKNLIQATDASLFGAGSARNALFGNTNFDNSFALPVGLRGGDGLGDVDTSGFEDTTGGFGAGAGGFGNGSGGFGAGSGLRVEQVRVPFPQFIEKHNIVAKSSTIKVGNDVFWGNGKIQILIYPYDNVLQFTIARDAKPGNNPVDNPTTVIPFDLNQNNEILLSFKNRNTTVESKLYLNNDNVNLSEGQVVFKIYQSQIPNIRKIYDSGINLFYIISKTNNSKDVIYSGTFEMWDAIENVNDLNDFADDRFGFDSTVADPNAIIDSAQQQETALVIRRRGTAENPGEGGAGGAGANGSGGAGANSDQIAALNGEINKKNAQINNSISKITGNGGGIARAKNTIRNYKNKPFSSAKQRDVILQRISNAYAMIEVLSAIDSNIASSEKAELDKLVDDFINARNKLIVDGKEVNNNSIDSRIKKWNW